MTKLLEVNDLEVAYDLSQVVFKVGFSVEPGEAITLIGRNGMGKTTTLSTVIGWLPVLRGDILFKGKNINRSPAYDRATGGISIVPEGRQVFPTLTVKENLIATARVRKGAASAWTLARIYQLFPRLKERERNLGSHLSGGEQQMLAIGRALMTNPDLLILDEATEGLAPLIRAEIWDCLKAIRDTGLSLIVVDKHIGPMIEFADRHYVIEKGRIVWSGSSPDLSRSPEVLEQYVGL